MERKFFENDWIWDIETYKNICTFAFAKADGSQEFVFEISSRNYELNELLEFCRISKNNNYRWVGYNSLGFDYPVLHWILQKAINAKSENKKLRITPNQIYNYAMKVIDSKRDGEYGISVKDTDIIIKQLDLFKMNHFDNKAKFTSLKLLEFNMRLRNLEDLPFEVGISLSHDQMQTLIEYNKWDVFATKEFYHHCYDAILFREDLTKKYGFDCTNLNDTKIGEKFFMQKIESENPNAFYYEESGRKVMKQTKRDRILIKDCIFPYVRFKDQGFRELKKWLERQVITETKGVFSDVEEHCLGNLSKYSEMVVKKVKFKQKPSESEITQFKIEHPLGWIEESELKAMEIIKDSEGNPIKEEYVCEKSGKVKLRNKKQPKKSYYGCFRIAETLNVLIDGYRLDLGTGGIHGSVQGYVLSTKDKTIVDLDVASYYPNMAIANRVYPEHLNESFCDSYESFYKERGNYAKGTGENLAIKLGLNATYGNSNNKYSPFYDPKYTMCITIGGQLSLCMLVEKLVQDCGVINIQSNTDGVTFLCDNDKLDSMRDIVKRWEGVTGLTMEENQYSSMYMRDVNSYVAMYKETGKLKQKGAYEYKDLAWHKNMSALVIPMAVEHELFKRGTAEDFIRAHKEPFDFMLRTKVPRSSSLVLEKDGVDIPQQNVCRYYPSVNGGKLIKIMPPLEDGGELRRMAIDKEWNVQPCNNMDDFHWDIDYDYYIQEAEKLLEPLRKSAL